MAALGNEISEIYREKMEIKEERVEGRKKRKK